MRSQRRLRSLIPMRMVRNRIASADSASSKRLSSPRARGYPRSSLTDARASEPIGCPSVRTGRNEVKLDGSRCLALTGRRRCHARSRTPTPYNLVPARCGGRLRSLKVTALCSTGNRGPRCEGRPSFQACSKAPYVRPTGTLLVYYALNLLQLEVWTDCEPLSPPSEGARRGRGWLPRAVVRALAGIAGRY